jgi:glycosyltransferase involved in cell wall biosynthesis
MNKPIKIGLLLNEPPVAEKSAPARSHEAITRIFAASLSPTGVSSHEIDFTTILMNSTDVAKDLAQCRSIYPNLVDRFQLFELYGRRPLSSKIANRLWPMSFHASNKMKRAVRALFQQNTIDILHVEQAWMAYALPRSFDPNRVLLSLQYLLETDMAAASAAESFAEKIRRKRLLQAERRLIRRCRYFRVLSAEMAETLRKIHPSAEIHVVPLAIDADSYEFWPRQTPENPVVSVIGSMYWPPSRSAAERMIHRLWPAIHATIPAARLQIVGRNAMQYFAEFQGRDSIEIYENVPDITPFFRQSNLLVYAPSAGSGMKVKVQESMLQGLPVLTNSSGIEGLAAKSGHDCLIAETDEDFIRQSILLLSNPELSQQIAGNARQLIETQCDPSRVFNQLKSVYSQIYAK